METDDEKTQMQYAEALAEYADAGGYDLEVTWDVCTVAGLGVPYDRAKYRELRTLSGGEQKRLVLEFLLRGPDEVLLLDEPDNFLDVPGKIWLEQRIRDSDKTILFISHDRELLANTATRVVTVELGAAGNLVWTHPGGFASYHEARKDRFLALRGDAPPLGRGARQDQGAGAAAQDQGGVQRRHGQPVQGGADPAPQVRGGKGPPTEQPREQQVTMRLKGGRTGKRAVVCEDLELSGLMRPFDLEVWYGERVAVLGSQRLRQVATSCGCWPRAAATPTSSTSRSRTPRSSRCGTPARPSSAPGSGPAGSCRPTSTPSCSGARCWRSCTAATAGPAAGRGMGREQAARVLDRYELAHASEQRFESLSGGQQARFQILLLELSGATLLLLDEPTDNLDVQSAEALEDGLEAFDGTVIAVTHDRWFARGFDRFLVYGADGDVYESDGPVWDEGRVARTR